MQHLKMMQMQYSLVGLWLRSRFSFIWKRPNTKHCYSQVCAYRGKSLCSSKASPHSCLLVGLMSHVSLSWFFCCLNDLLEEVIAVISETGIEGILKYQIVLVIGFLINHFYNCLDSTNRSEHCIEMSALQM